MAIAMTTESVICAGLHTARTMPINPRFIIIHQVATRVFSMTQPATYGKYIFPVMGFVFR